MPCACSSRSGRRGQRPQTACVAAASACGTSLRHVLNSGENPFRWRGHLDKLLPKRALLTRGHHKAMPFADVPAFVGRLRAMQGVAPRALEFAILTAARTGEVLGARWDEIDLGAKLWAVP